MFQQIQILTSGNAANIILAQVSGTSKISLLLGAFEVVGSEAEFNYSQSQWN